HSDPTASDPRVGDGRHARLSGDWLAPRGARRLVSESLGGRGWPNRDAARPLGTELLARTAANPVAGVGTRDPPDRGVYRLLGGSAPESSLHHAAGTDARSEHGRCR